MRAGRPQAHGAGKRAASLGVPRLQSLAVCRVRYISNELLGQAALLSRLQAGAGDLLPQPRIHVSDVRRVPSANLPSEQQCLRAAAVRLHRGNDGVLRFDDSGVCSATATKWRLLSELRVDCESVIAHCELFASPL